MTQDSSEFRWRPQKRLGFSKNLSFFPSKFGEDQKKVFNQSSRRIFPSKVAENQKRSSRIRRLLSSNQELGPGPQTFLLKRVAPGRGSTSGRICPPAPRQLSQCRRAAESIGKEVKNQPLNLLLIF